MSVDPSIITDDVVKAAEGASSNNKQRLSFTTSTGVVLKYKKVPSQLLYKAWANLERPKVPEVWIEERGRFEPHPQSPDYLEALGQFRYKRVNVTTMIYFMRGIDIISVPENMSPPSSDEWFADLIEFGIEIPQSASARQAAWLMYYAEPDENNQGEILSDLMAFSGMVLEADVADAIDSFRDNEESGVDSKTQSTSGD